MNRSSTARVRARCWLLCYADVCCVGSGVYSLATEYSSQCWFNKVCLLCPALKLLLEKYGIGCGVLAFTFLHPDFSSPFSLPSLLSFRRGTPSITPPILKEKKKILNAVCMGPFNPVWFCGMSLPDLLQDLENVNVRMRIFCFLFYLLSWILGWRVVVVVGWVVVVGGGEGGRNRETEGGWAKWGEEGSNGM